MRGLSELEGCVLGHLWRFGPCSAYAVRKEMLLSPSTHWSGSAGAIYPLLVRLERRGLVLSRRAPRGGRDGRLYGLTKAGRGRFLTWLGPPFEPDVVSIAIDPLRTRVHFLGALPPRRRRAFLSRARTELARHLRELAAHPVSDAFDRLALLGAVRLTRARVAWLCELQSQAARITRCAPRAACTRPSGSRRRR